MGCCAGKEAKAIEHQNRENAAMQDTINAKEQRERELTAILQQFPQTPNPVYVVESPSGHVYIPDYYVGRTTSPPLRNV